MIQVPELLKPVAIDAPEPAPSAISPLAAAAGDFARRQGQDFLHSMETVATINPDAYAQATAVSRYSGVPAKVLHDHQDRLKALLRGNEYAGIYERFNKTAGALRDSNMAAISQDDLDQLVRIEGAASDARFNERSTGEKLWGSIRQQWISMRQSRGVARAIDYQDELERFDLIDQAEAAGEIPLGTVEQRQAAGNFGLQYLAAPPEQRAQIRAMVAQGQADRLSLVAQDEQTLADMPVDPGARRAAELESLGQSSLSATAEALVENPGYALRTTAGAAATSAPMLLAGAIGGPVAAGAVGYSMEQDAKLLDVLREAGVDPADPKSVLRAMQDDGLMADAERRAALKAGGTTAVDMVSMSLASRLLVPSRIAGRQLSTAQRELANLAVQLPVQGVTEGLGEAAGQFAAEGEVNAGEVLLETVAGAGMSSVDVLAFSNRRFIEYLGDGLRKSREARVGADALAEMADAATGSKTRGRDRDTFRAIADQQLQGSPMESIWLPAEALQRLNQSAQINLPELLTAVPGLSEQFADAVARGGSVSMKTADYLAVFADYHEQLASSVRINADGLSPTDVEAWTVEQEAQLDALAEELRTPPDTAAELTRQMVGELVGSGFRRADAEQYAATHLSVMQNLAERSGIALEQLRQQYQLDIGTQAPEQLRAVKVDDARLAIQRLRAGDIPRPGDMFGQSLREYLVAGGGVNDQGGELSALDADTGRVGRNRLIRQGGKSLDQAAMDAWERGYFPGVVREAVGPQLIVDAMQRELAGQPVYSVEQENATLRDQAATLEQLQEYLDRLGVDIAEMSDDEVLAMLQGQGDQVEGQRLDQGSQRFSEDNRLSNLSMTGASWERIRAANPALRRVNSPDAEVTIYRATIGDAIRPDDFVGLDRSVAEMELENVIDRDGEGARIIEQRVPVRDLLMGNDATEFVYFPEAQRLNQAETRDQLVTRLTEQNPGLKLDLLGRGQRALLSRIELPKGERQQGAGTQIMQEITAWADANGVTVSLSPSGDFGGSKARLVGFYKRFGFVENKGKNRDFEISEAMYREPMRRLNQSAVSDVSEIRGIDAELQAMASDLLDNGANITPDGRVSLYHRTSAEAAAEIQASGRMTGAEDGLFFSTKRDGGTASEFGDTVLEFSIPLEELQVDDTFGSEAHVRVPLEFAGEVLNVSQWLNRKTLNQSGDDNARGFITFQPRQQTGEQRRFQITLGDKRDLTTLLHELGHFYLEVLDDIAAGENAPEQIARDAATLRKWMGAGPGAALTVDQHEQFARGFELYLAEGKAPNPELAGAFARFKRWLIGVYKDLTRLNVQLTDDVRSVFDRLVATDEQINAAEQVSNAIPLFADAQAAGMTDTQFAAYQDSVAVAHAEAQESVERDVQREEERRRSKWWREESAKVRDEVTEEVDTLPVYAAMRALRRGQMPDGTVLNIKMNSAELTERYGASTSRRLAFTHSRDGAPLDVVGPMLGYESGDELVKAMLGAAPRSQLIEQETQQRMLERHGPKSTGEAAERALDAVHNERRADVLQKELTALGKQGNRNNITSQQILKEAARRVMSERKVRDIQPAEYQRAEAKAGREAFDAARRGNLDAAYEAKQRQLLNFYLYREARKARESVDAIVARMAKYNKRSTRERLGKAGHDYLDQIDAVMEQYEFRTVPLRDLDRRVSFQAWYADQLARGNEPFVPEFLLNTSRQVNYKDLSLDQLQELDEFAANVSHLARTKNKLLANQRLRDFDEARTELIRAGYNNRAKRKASPIDRNTRSMIEKLGDQAGEFSAALIKMEQVVDWLDGGQVDGPWSTAFWQPFVDAQAEKERLNREFAIKMTELVDGYTAERGAKVMHQQTYIAGLGQSLTHNAILSAALNTGNASNRQKLLNGGHNGQAWTEQQLNEITGNLTARDWEFVQSLWDLVEELWPSIEALEKDLHGIPPEKVQPVPVTTQYGEFRGGYWPLVYDTSSSAYAGVQNQLGNEGGLFEQGYARATTPKGHTKARVDSFAAPIMLDVEIIAQHLGQVIHDLTHRKAIRDGAKIIGDKQIKQMLIDTLGPAVANQFNPWLQGVANDMVLDSQKGIDAWTRAAERLRANLAVGFMGFSATTGLQQVLGYSQTFEFFSKIGAKRYVFQGMQEFIRAPWKAIAFVNELSPEMRYRVDNLDRDMRGVLKRISGKSDALSIVQRLAFKHIGVVQALVDYPTWLAGYRHGLDTGLSAADAVAAGDRAVRLSQMAAGPKDLAAVQRKDGLMRALTIVYSYFNLLYNRTIDIKDSVKSARSVGEYMNAFERTMFLIAIPAVLGPLVTGQGPGDDEDWRAWASLKIATYPLLGIPGLRDLASSFESGWAYSGVTPIGELFKSLSKLRGVGVGVSEGETPEAERLAIIGIEAVGYGFGLPVAQPKRTIKYLFGVAEGEIEPEGVTDWTRGLLFGPPKE